MCVKDWVTIVWAILIICVVLKDYLGKVLLTSYWSLFHILWSAVPFEYVPLIDLRAHTILMKLVDVIGEGSREEKDMHVDEFQDMMRRIYLHRDLRRGMERTHEWFLEEIGELGEALEGEDRKALEDEFADALAWLASLANVANIDLEKAVLAKYDDKCPKCQQTPCKCPFRFP